MTRVYRVGEVNKVLGINCGKFLGDILNRYKLGCSSTRVKLQGPVWLFVEKLLLYRETVGNRRRFMAYFHGDWSKSSVVKYDIVSLLGQDRTER